MDFDITCHNILYSLILTLYASAQVYVRKTSTAVHMYSLSFSEGFKLCTCVAFYSIMD